ncbi:ELWxxDGT repeat protein [Lewinella sp. 4G2]|uniref:ELWxxDGT repeat protein n=1 Tax=Lewinella sp. 4G2 TaxID=1803372 RepID=UPI0007B4D560|nr:ELWxxDGT repeat protein [Lewinella sp. 4G2]OAV44636.1 hypothetical protein A3850_009090 [Lewinella sp. 4G2]
MTNKPFLHHFLLLTTLLGGLFGPALSAQDAQQLSNFNYGNVHRSQVDQVYAVGDRLFATYRSVNGQGGAGLISEIDPTTGNVRALLDPQQSSLFSAGHGGTAPGVYGVGELIFAALSDAATGGGLYRIDGDRAELVYAAPGARFSKVVAAGGNHYFLATSTGSGLDLTTGTNDFLTLLLRTDGTAAGTAVVTSIPTNQFPTLLEISASADRLLLTVGNETETLLYLNDVATSALKSVTQANGEELRLRGVLAHQFSNQAPVFQAEQGSFYGFLPDGASVSLFQIPAGGTQAVPTDLGNDGKFGHLFVHDGTLHTLSVAGRNRAGITIHQVSAAGQTLPVLELTDHQLLQAPLTTAGKTLFLLRKGGQVTAQQFTGEGLRPFAGLPLGNYAPNAHVSGSVIYFNVEQDGNTKIACLNVRTGAVETFSLPEMDVAALRTVASGGQLFLLDPAEEVGLYDLQRWAPGQATVTPVGQFSLGRGPERPFIYGANQATGELLLRQGGDDLIHYGREASTEALQLPAGVTGLLTSARSIANTTFVSGQRGPNTYVDFVLTKKGLKEPTYRLADGKLIQGRNTRINFGLEGGHAVVTLDDEASTKAGFRFGLVGEGGSEGLLLSPIDPIFSAADAYDIPVPTYVSPGYFATELRTGGSAIYRVFDAAGTVLGNYGADAGCRVRGIGTNHVFLESSANVLAPRQMIVLNKNTGAALKTMPFPGTEVSPQYRETYVLGDRLIFVGLTAEHGRELFVVDAANDAVQVFKDIRPGAGQGIATTEIVRLGDRLYFAANDGTQGNELYVTDGTAAGTTMVMNLNPGAASANPADFLVHNGILYFAANGPSGYELYQLPEGASSPSLLLDLAPGTASSFPFDLTTDGDRLYFMAVGSDGYHELYNLPFSLVSTDGPLASAPAKVYPNPYGDEPVTLEAPFGEQITRIVCFDATGREVLAVSGQSSPTLQLNGANKLPGGQYWLRTTYASGKTSLNAIIRK